MRSVALIGALVVVGGWTVGCDDDEAYFDATISAPIECLSQQFPFEPTFFAASATSVGAVVRMQNSTLTRTRIDSFNMTFYSQPNPLSGMECPFIDVAGAGAYDVGPGACIQAYFRFNDECSREYVNPHVVGTVTLDQIGFEEGDIIEGTIDGQLVDARLIDSTGEPELVVTPIGDVSGRFRFEVRVGPAYQTYDLPDRHIDQPF